MKAELETTLSVLSGKGKGTKYPRGPERKKMWEEVRELRKEYALYKSFLPVYPHEYFPLTRFRRRERGVVSAVLQESQVSGERRVIR